VIVLACTLPKCHGARHRKVNKEKEKREEVEEPQESTVNRERIIEDQEDPIQKARTDRK